MGRQWWIEALRGPVPLLEAARASSFQTILWVTLGFVLGAVPFAVIIARLLTRRDPRQVGDHNPGAINAWRSSGAVVGLLAILAEGLKGWVPVGLAYWVSGVSGWALVPLMMAPVLGHAYSPFLRGHGGKSIAVTFGVWAGLTLWRVPILYGALLVFLMGLLRLKDGWTAVLGWAVVTIYLVWSYPSVPVIAAAVLNGVILVVRHRGQLRLPLRRTHA